MPRSRNIIQRLSLYSRGVFSSVHTQYEGNEQVFTIQIWGKAPKLKERPGLPTELPRLSKGGGQRYPEQVESGS